MAKDNGGPAFPRPASEFTKSGTLADGNDAIESQAGMSLRDYFAAKAMQEIVSAVLLSESVRNATSDMAKESGVNDARVIARFAFDQADAMLAERSKS